MNYIQSLRERLEEKIPGLPDELLDLYVLLAVTKGVNTSMENVHDAWSLWANTLNGEHKSLIPFDELTPEVQELDRPYMNAIVELALELFSV